ncbi:double-strand-break repair protein rad21 [Novymonas esmeraldas]|uniref:Double-strand-break repair protein rad21 n=1 Tax=Novymonas esmeraldas TaxID=1808958 RepID=A0AAW0EWF3_9TRYP
MFFSTYVLTKKGPLAKVWLAAHWDKRLTRHEVKVVDLSQTILHIVRPVVPIALRTSGELLVGVVRIYALKVKHLLKEATEATLLLRVTTLAAKGGKAGQAGQHRTTSIDGVVVPVKGSEVEAVTFDWNAEVAAKHGAAADVADAFGNGRFDAIADLLGGGRRVDGPDGGKEDALLASAWYTVQPTSQAGGDDPAAMQQRDYDEIAKMRADLMAFGERASGSSASKSKSSLSSVEKGRGSVAAGADGVAFPAVGDELDIGVPLPDEFPADFPALEDAAAAVPGMLPADPFLLPDTMTMDEAAAVVRPGRRFRPLNVRDLASTTLSREEFEACMTDRHDILNSEPRRGPYDAQEAADRCTVAGAAGAGAHPAMEAEPLSGVLNPALRLAYAAALRQSVAEAVEEAARASMARRGEVAAATAFDADEGQLAGAGLDGSGAALQEGGEESPQRRKRDRDYVDGDAAAEETTTTTTAGLSASAQHTLERIRAELATRATAAAQSRKKARVESPPASALVGTRCALREVCRGLRRREAARAFVDVLALASKQYVGAAQAAGSDEVQVTLNEAALRLLSVA